MVKKSSYCLMIAALCPALLLASPNNDSGRKEARDLCIAGTTACATAYLWTLAHELGHYAFLYPLQKRGDICAMQISISLSLFAKQSGLYVGVIKESAYSSRWQLASSFAGPMVGGMAALAILKLYNGASEYSQSHDGYASLLATIKQPTFNEGQPLALQISAAVGLVGNIANLLPFAQSTDKGKLSTLQEKASHEQATSGVLKADTLHEEYWQNDGGQIREYLQKYTSPGVRRWAPGVYSASARAVSLGTAYFVASSLYRVHSTSLFPPQRD